MISRPTTACFSAPARCDLAGGTLDLWPLYLFFENARTVNLAISRRQRAQAEVIGSGFEVRSVDQKFERRFAGALQAREDSQCRLAAEAAISAGRTERVRIEIESAVPIGSGLGGSSAMLVALMASLRALEGQSDFDGEFVQVCRDTETRLLGFPAGTQDYEVALRGGLQILSYGPGAGTFERAAVDLDQLSRHLVLFDSGSSHASGLNNWEVYRSCIEGDTAVREALGGVRDAALTMTEAARRGDVEAMGKALGDEWRWRRRLSARVSTPILDEAAEKGLAAGAWGAKVCGAGGGGVMVFLGPAELRQEISRRLSKISGQAILDARPESRGLLREV